MSYSIFRDTYASLLFLALGFIATTTALVTRDHPFSPYFKDPKGIPIESGRFSENCDSVLFDPKTCVLTANCKPNIGKKRNTTRLNLNKCLWYHNTYRDATTDIEGLGWWVEWNEKDKDPQGLTNICALCDINILHMNGDNYNHPLEVEAKCSPPPGKPGDQYKHRSIELFLDQHISNNDGNMECFGKRGE